MKLFTKRLLDIVRDVREYDKAPNEYILAQSKHIPRGDEVLLKKVDEFRKFAGKIHGECNVTCEPYISGDERCVRFTLYGDLVVMKQFDAMLQVVNDLKQRHLPRGSVYVIAVRSVQIEKVYFGTLESANRYIASVPPEEGWQFYVFDKR